MKVKPFLKKATVLGLSAACCLVFFGCGGNNYGFTGGVAATVNGAEIEEDTITKYIQDFRTSSELTTNDDWANWMTENSLDPSTVRSQVIDYYVTQEITRQAAEQEGITIDSSRVDEELNSMKSNYDSDQAWQEALSTAGVTEEQYRESIEEGLLEQDLQAKVVTDEQRTVSDDQLLETLNMYASMFDGAKRSSHILFASGDEATAQEVLDRINSGELSFEDAVSEYSTDTGSAESGGDVGWDCLTTFVEPYTAALEGLSKGQISGLVTSDYGIHIIKVTDEFYTDGTATSVDEFPQEIRDYVYGIVESQNSSSAYSDWITSFKEQAEIVINDMPENVPYNLEMTTDEQTAEGEISAEGNETTDASSGEAPAEGGTEATTEANNGATTEGQ